jgi:hypothetical protein
MKPNPTKSTKKAQGSSSPWPGKKLRQVTKPPSWTAGQPQEKELIECHRVYNPNGDRNDWYVVCNYMDHSQTFYVP